MTAVALLDSPAPIMIWSAPQGQGQHGESPALARFSCPAAPTQITEMNLALEGIGLTDKLIPFFLRLLIDVDFSPGGCKS